MVVRDEKNFREEFDISATASYILRNGFRRVALQFPDELLHHSVQVSSALSREFLKQRELRSPEELGSTNIRLFVMGDTTYGSCCADEVAAMHVDAQCIVHYGHTCLSLTSRLPVWFVFGKATIDAEKCANCIADFAASSSKPILVLFALKYVYAAATIQQKVAVMKDKDLNISFASTPSRLMEPITIPEEHERGCQMVPSTVEHGTISTKNIDVTFQAEEADCLAGQYGKENAKTSGCSTAREVPWVGASKPVNTEHKIGGLRWTIPYNRTMDDYIILWIGADDPGLANILLVFNMSTVIRYDSLEDKMVTDGGNQLRFLQRRYYYVERAKDASVVGIVMGTLGVAGYQGVMQSIRKMVEASGKKAYTLVMGKPNPSKLANFPECEVFVLVACPQSALLDSKNFLAPLITPFEAELAFVQGRQWTGAYRLDFAMTDPNSQSIHARAQESAMSGPRFSFFTGSYVGEDHSEDQDGEDLSSRAVVLSRTSQHALALQSTSALSVNSAKRSVLDIKSGAEYLASRTYSGLDIDQEGPDGPRKASLAVVGQTGRAAGYRHENV